MSALFIQFFDNHEKLSLCWDKSFAISPIFSAYF